MDFYGENLKYDESCVADSGVSNLLFDQTHEAADSVLDRLPAHRRNLFEEEHRKLSKDSSSAFQIVPTTHPSSIQLRQVSYHSYTWDLFVIMSDID